MDDVLVELDPLYGGDGYLEGIKVHAHCTEKDYFHLIFIILGWKSNHGDQTYGFMNNKKD